MALVVDEINAATAFVGNLDRPGRLDGGRFRHLDEQTWANEQSMPRQEPVVIVREMAHFRPEEETAGYGV